MPSARAVIDVGTNSVKLLIAEVDGAAVRPLLERNEQTRLGQGFYETRVLQPEPIARTARAVARFAAEAAASGVGFLRIIATSAARDARNRSDLLDAVKSGCGREVEVISGDQEADWAYAGVLSNPELEGRPLLIMDIGGGSTEFILGEGKVKYFRESFRLGTVRLMESHPVSDPPAAAEEAECSRWIADFLNAQARPALEAAFGRLARRDPLLVVTGGTPAILGSIHLRLPEFDRARLEALHLSREDVGRIHERLWSLPLSERRLVPGLPENRADVILTGSAVIREVMRVFALPEFRISTRGMRFAALLDCDPALMD